MHFYLYGTFVDPKWDDLTRILLDGDADIWEDLHDSQRRPPDSLTVLCDPQQTSFERDAAIITKYKPIVCSGWVLDCVSAMEILPKHPYAAL